MPAQSVRRENEERTRSRWSTVSDHQFFSRIPEWKRSTKEKNKYDMYEKGRTTKIISRIIFFFSLNCLFVLLGTFVFIKIEGSSVDRKAEKDFKTYESVWKPRNISALKLEEIRQIATRICEIQTFEIEQRKMDWNYFHSIHFTYSVITTIGFGEQTAKTFWGRLATIIYAVFGIILFILFMASFRVLLIALINKAMSWLTKHGHSRMVRGRARSTRIRRIVKVVLTVTMIIVLWTISSLFTWYLNDWSWFWALYNIFIAVTTIGFGDEVVIEKGGFIYMMNIILILTLFSTLFEQLKQNNVSTVSKRISHLVNSINQAHSEYIVIGPVFSRQARDMITPCGRESLGIMPTITESPGENMVIDSVVENASNGRMSHLECVERANGEKHLQFIYGDSDVCPNLEFGADRSNSVTIS